MSKLIGLNVPQSSAERVSARKTTVEDWRVFTTGVVFNMVLEEYPDAKLLFSMAEHGYLDAEIPDKIPFQAHPAMVVCETIIQVDPAHNMPHLLRVPVGILALDIPQWTDADRVAMTRKAVRQTIDAWRAYVASADAALADAGQVH